MAHGGLSTVVLIDYDKVKGKIALRSITDDAYSRLDVSELVTADVADACDDYWKFVNQSIEGGLLTRFGERGLRLFYDKLISKGTILSRLLFSPATCRQFFSLARQSSTLILITDLLYVPWEALFEPDQKCFLLDLCVIVRWPRSSPNKDIGPSSPIFENRRAVCLDPFIAEDERHQVDFVLLREYLEAHFGADLMLTSLTGKMVEAVQSTRMIYWVCEHAKEGLRVGDSVFYSFEDCEAHPFGEGAILVLSSCRSGSGDSQGKGIAPAICCASRCTVIAPSSVLATAVGARFAKKIDQQIVASQKGVKLSDVWRDLCVSHKTIKERPDLLTPETCFVYWYGIYGDGEAILWDE